MSTTKKRDLRTGRSVWQAQPMKPVAYRRLTADLVADVLVVGAGISGAMIAEQLTDAGLDVLIVDRRGPLRGSTPASTALLQYEIDEPMTDLAKAVGKERCQRFWRRSKLALDALRERTRRLGIDCDMLNRDGLYIEGDAMDAAALQREVEIRREAGFETVFLDAGTVQKRFAIRDRAALLGFDNVSADPRRMAAGYLRAALRRGARLYAPVEITDVEPLSASVRCQTRTGRVICASHLVFATGYETPKGVPSKGHSIISTFALATRPQPRKLWPEQCFIWEASDPYLYMRVGPNGEVICGGEDEEFADEERRDAMLDAKIAIIEEKLGALFPKIDSRAAFRWCGSFGKSETGTPSIGRIPKMPNCYAALGYGGNGITYSAIAGQLLRAMITGRNDPDADLYSFSRKF
jgi:glycine/D-amino acid oxidase-like deaminating enzyme